jgi:single-strand DNA-binding protein
MNKAILIGNLTRDPELKYTPNGTAVCTFGVATNRSWTTTDGQIKEDTQFHRVVAWQKLAELCGKLLTKGKKIYMEGRITYRNFTGKDGQQRSITEIVLDDFIMFDSGKRVVPGEAAPVTGDVPSHVDVTVPAEHSEAPDHANEHVETVNPEDIPF